MGFLAWIVTGLIAGWLAGKVMKGGGYGVIVDIILGLLGGVGRRMAVWPDRDLAGRRDDWSDHRCVRRRGNPGLDYPPHQEGLARQRMPFTRPRRPHLGIRGLFVSAHSLILNE